MSVDTGVPPGAAHPPIAGRPEGPWRPWITAPGTYDLPSDEYHRDPVKGGSLSNTGAGKLMPPSCPALFRAWADGLIAEHKDVWDFGAAAHREVLGVGDRVVVIAGSGKDPNSWVTEDTKAEVAAAREAGLRPIRPRDAETIPRMAAALRAHPMASALLTPDSGRAEQTLIWRDEESGVMCRALVDWLRHNRDGGRPVLVDYKTAERIDPWSIERVLWEHRYYGQAAWYAEGAQALGHWDEPPVFILVFQMKDPPYLVVCAQVADDAIGWGHARNRKARDLYARCTERQHWPGYADDHVVVATLPGWAKAQLEAAERLGELEPEGRVF